MTWIGAAEGLITDVIALDWGKSAPREPPQVEEILRMLSTVEAVVRISRLAGPSGFRLDAIIR